MIWPPSKAISMRTRSPLANRDDLRADTVDRVRVDKRDLEPEEAGPRLRVDQVGARPGELIERLTQIPDLVGDVMHAGAALREEPADRSLLTERLEQLHAPLANRQRSRPHTLVRDRRAMLDLGAEEPLVCLERGVEILDGDSHMVNAPRPHEAMLPSERRSVGGKGNHARHADGLGGTRL